MKLGTGLLVLALAAVLTGGTAPARAARSGLALAESTSTTAPDVVEARQFHIADARVAGSQSARQSVTAWQVVHGSWNGQSLDGLSLVLVKTIAEDGQSPPMVNCYISHLATRSQRTALLSAYLSNAPSDQVGTDSANWRIEPAVIRLEFVGQTVIIHLGAVA